MTAQEPFHHVGRRLSRLALRGIVPVALVDDIDLLVRRHRFGPVVDRTGRGVGGLRAHGDQVSPRGVNLQARHEPRSRPSYTLAGW